MSVKKLDYNGLQTLIQTIKSYLTQYISSKLSELFPLSGGVMTGEIEYTPNSNDENNISLDCGIFSVSKYGTKGTYPESIKYFTCFVARDDSKLNSNDAGCRYGLLETVVHSDGTIDTYIAAYKNEANSGSVVQLTLTYPITGDPYIKIGGNFKL